MDVAQIFFSILNRPNVPRPYGDLKAYYENNNLNEEASAILYLIEKKFEKNNETTINNTHDSQE